VRGPLVRTYRSRGPLTRTGRIDTGEALWGSRSLRVVDRLGYLILYVSDLGASIAFYRDVVGLDLKFVDAGYAEFATHGARFGLFESRRAEWLIGRPVSPGPAAEAVFVVDDVDAQVSRLAELGVPVLSPPANRPWGHRTLHVADPDGFVVEFAQQIPRRRHRRDA
jgi:lactoylglutathione lyase